METLEALLKKVIEENESLSLDDDNDRTTLIKALSKALTPIDYTDVVTISRAIFPDAKVDETFNECEIVVNTGLYNVAAGGEIPLLIAQDREPISTEIFPASDIEYVVVENIKEEHNFDSFLDDEDDDKTTIGVVSEDIEGPDVW